MSVIMLSLLAALSANPQGPEWMSDYGQALAATRAARQPLLVVLEHGTAPSASLTQVSHQESVPPAELLGPYTLCRVDVSTPYGQKVADAFRVTTFPYAAILDNTGSFVLARRAGPLSASEWSTLLTTHQSGARAVVAQPVISSNPPWAAAGAPWNAGPPAMLGTPWMGMGMGMRGMPQNCST